MNEKDHIPVLLSEVLHYLDLSNGDNVIDATLGTGGHSQEILKIIGTGGRLYGVDADMRNLERAKQYLGNHENFTPVHGNFRDLSQLVTGRFDAILFDLGLHSLHVDDPDRGFSFLREGPLDMRFDTETQGITAAMIVNQSNYDQLVSIFSGLGQERYSKRIAQAIVDARKHRPFRTTIELAQCIERAVPHKQSSFKGKHKRHPATQCFQALRIAVNQEFEALTDGLTAAVDLLKEGGRLVVISYHSLEDRIVKNFIRDRARRLDPITLKILTKKPITASASEIAENPRSRSALLRAAEKL